MAKTINLKINKQDIKDAKLPIKFNKIDKKFKSVIREKKITGEGDVIVMAHVNPDLDAIGSSVASTIMLKSVYGINAQIVLPSKLPPAGYIEKITNKDNVSILYWNVNDDDNNKIKELFLNAKLIVINDLSGVSQLGPLWKYVILSKAFKFIFDHHTTPQNFSCKDKDRENIKKIEKTTDPRFYKMLKKLTNTDTLMIRDEKISSTCELHFNLLTHYCRNRGEFYFKDSLLNRYIYMGLITDTNNYSNGNTSPATHMVASLLGKYGVNYDSIYKSIYLEAMTKGKAMLRGKVIAKSEWLYNDKIVISSITDQEYNKYNLPYDNQDGFVEDLKAIKGVEMAVLFREWKGKGQGGENIISISFRSMSDEIDLLSLDRDLYSGGGHKMAAGATFAGSLNDCEKKFKDAVLAPDFESKYVKRSLKT